MSTAVLPTPGVDLGFRPIGPSHHRTRNALVTLGVTLFGFLIVGTAVYWTHNQVLATDQLSRFGATYADRCGLDDYPTGAAEKAKSLYLRSARLRQVIDRELVALESGAACEDVNRALRAADFPMSSLNAPTKKGARIMLPAITIMAEPDKP